MIFHVVLHEPEIPNNTGNIGRTCVATRCALHLIRPLGFDLSEKACRRAGLDYWPRLDLHVHDDWDAYLREAAPERLWMLTTRSGRSLFDVEIHEGDHLVLGKETAGLPKDLLDAHASSCVSLPMAPGERSLNVATVACAAVYEGIRQCRARGRDVP
ncbi:MAG: tRNA (cytidine(34)-2'-O)-methyltransferase [Phycisphaerales bacterium]|nr:tRNA (cytidine(34)-2'-O)-methyltransferase [Phycisphaerales bacterium]